jgi:hypothetical protein
MTSPRYQLLDVIRERGRTDREGARRWQVIAVNDTDYLVHLLYSGYREPDWSRWSHEHADAFTELEWSPGPEAIGVTCARGHSRKPPATCDCKPA